MMSLDLYRFAGANCKSISVLIIPEYLNYIQMLMQEGGLPDSILLVLGEMNFFCLTVIFASSFCEGEEVVWS
jgi:hypothetical protein